MDEKTKAAIRQFIQDAKETGLSEGAIALMATGMVLVSVLELVDVPDEVAGALAIAIDARTSAETKYILWKEPNVDKEALEEALTKALETLEDDDELPLRF